MKYLLLAIIVILSTSCAKSIYYEGDYGGYCALEITPKNDLVMYLSGATTVDNSDLICFFCENVDIDRKKHLIFGFSLYECKYLNVKKDGKLSRGTISSPPLNSSKLEDFFSYEANSMDELYGESEYKLYDVFSENPIYKKTGIKTLPSFMIKVDSISYSSFSLSTRKYDLKKEVRRLKKHGK